MSSSQHHLDKISKTHTERLQLLGRPGQRAAGTGVLQMAGAVGGHDPVVGIVATGQVEADQGPVAAGVGGGRLSGGEGTDASGGRLPARRHPAPRIGRKSAA